MCQNIQLKTHRNRFITHQNKQKFPRKLGFYKTIHPLIINVDKDFELSN